MSALDGIKARLQAATPGPRKTVRHGLSLYVEAESGELNPIDLGYVGNRPENNAESIAHAPTDLARLVAAVEAVEKLHQPEKRWMAYEGAEVSYDTERDALEAGEDCDLGTVALQELAENGAPYFEVCKECGRVEGDQLSEMGEEWGYRESLWPCPTVKALAAALGEAS